jgi:hypothetical protein
MKTIYLVEQDDYDGESSYTRIKVAYSTKERADKRVSRLTKVYGKRKERELDKYNKWCDDTDEVSDYEDDIDFDYTLMYDHTSYRVREVSLYD